MDKTERPMSLADLMDQIKELGRRIEINRAVLVLESTVTDIKIRVFSKDHAYHIHGQIQPDRDKTYLGCVMSNRAPEAGESHTRGSDLPDGQLTWETWNRILIGIVAYELVPIRKSIGRYQEAVGVFKNSWRPYRFDPDDIESNMRGSSK